MYTGTCNTGATECYEAAPLQDNYNNADGAQTTPVSSGAITMVPATGPGTQSVTVTDNLQNRGLRPATTTLRQGFDLSLQSNVTGNQSQFASEFTSPTGSVQYFVDGQLVHTSTLASVTPTSGDGTTPLYLYNIGNLAPGTHTVLSNYSGDGIYAPTSFTETFTVIAGPPLGTLYSCDVVTGQGAPAAVSAYVAASGAVSPTFAGSTATATGVGVTLDIDPAVTVS